jgi:hypothetical protein
MMDQNRQTINIRPEDTKPVVCQCGGQVFQECFMIRRISAIISPTGKEEEFQIPVPVCIACGRPLVEMDKGEENGSDV